MGSLSVCPVSNFGVLVMAVNKVDCHDVLMLGTHVAISDTAHDLGVVIDRELLLAAHVMAVCRSGYNQLRQLRPVVHSVRCP